MSRSLKKGPYLDERLLKKVSLVRPGERAVIKTWSRAAVITPEMVSITFAVHTGNNFANVLVTEDMVGHRLGEFAPTRKFRRHGGKMAKEQEQSSPAASPAK